MRKLITAANVKDWADNKELTVRVETGTIITPAARDAARDYGIEIVEGVGGCQGSPAVGPAETPQPKGFDQVMITKIVEEVIASMGLGKPSAYESDPSGFKLARGDRLNMGDCSGQDAAKQVFGGNCSPGLSAGFLSVAAIPRDRTVRGSEIHYILAGSVCYRINGREYTSRAGDVAYLPAGARVSLVGADTAKLFFVACPD